MVLNLDYFFRHEVVVNDICSLYKRTYYNIRHRITPASPQICLYAIKFLSTPSEGLSHPTSLLHIFTTQRLLPDVQSTCSACSVIQQSFKIVTRSASSPDVSISGFYSDPDFLAELFYWIADLMKDRDCSQVFVTAVCTDSELLMDVFQMMLKNMTRQESLAFRNCLSGLTEFVRFSANDENLANMQKCCIDGLPFIVETICDAITGISLNSNGLDAFANLLLQVSCYYGRALESVLKNCLAQSKYSATHSSEAEKSYFISNVLKEKRSKANMREFCQNFHVSCVGAQSNSLIIT